MGKKPFAALLIALALLGCRDKKREECTRIRAMIESADAAVVVKSDAGDAKGLAAEARALGAAPSKLANDLSGAHFEVPELSRMALEYALVAKDLVATTEVLAKTLDELGALSEQVAPAKNSPFGKLLEAAERFKEACKAKPAPKGCAEVGEAFKGVPQQDQGPLPYARDLDATAARLRKVPIDDRALGAIVEEMALQLETLAKAHRRLPEVEERQKSNQAQQNDLLAKEKTVRASIRAFCAADSR